MRKQIKWTEIEAVLQSYYDRKANGEIENANILLFEKGDGDYTEKIVGKWFEKNNITKIFDFGQYNLFEEDSQHILHKTKEYAISDEAIQCMNRENTVLYMRNFNSYPKEALAISNEIMKNRRVVDAMHGVNVGGLFLTFGFCHYSLFDDSFNLGEYEPYTDIYEIEFDKEFVENHFRNHLGLVENYAAHDMTENEHSAAINAITTVQDVIAKVDLSFSYENGENWFSPMSAINLFDYLMREVEALYEDNIDLDHNTAVKKGFLIIMNDYREGTKIGGVSLPTLQKIYQEYFGES